MHNLKGFAVTSTLYEGGNTRVVRAVAIDTDMPVIIKTPAASEPSLQATERYQLEYDTLKSIGASRNIVAAVSLIHQDHIPFLVLADFGGTDLKTLTASHRLDLGRQIDIAAQAANALDEIYQAGIIHKDIKLSNIIYNINTGELKLCDFSSATIVSRETPSMDRSILMAATLPYMSPEQTGRMNRLVDWRTDYYSFGVTLYELFTGRLPFLNTEPLELVHAHMALMPSPPHEINKELPSVLSDIIFKLMAKNAEDRYQSAGGITADLEECRGRLKAHGKIEAFSLGLQDIPDRFQIPQKLYGRNKELDILLAAFDRVSEGGKEMMLVAGRPGIGKTSLINEIYKPVTKARGYFISGKFDQFQRNVPYSAIVKAFQSLVRQLLGESRERFSAWRESLLAAVGPNGQVIIDAIPEVELIIGPQPAVPELEPVESRNRFTFVFRNFIHVFCKSEHPMVVFIDDLQWIDAASLNFLELMITDEKAAYLFLIGAYRNTEVDTGHPLLKTFESLKTEKVKSHELMLEGLDIGNTAELIADTFYENRDAVETLARHVVNKTNGNPFFVNEFLKSLYSEKLIAFNSATSCWQWDLEKIKVRNITDNVVELMTEKIQKLAPHTIEALKLAAAMGNHFELGRLAMVLEKPIVDVTAYLDGAVNKGLILAYSQMHGASLFSEYRFSHDRIQQAAYLMIPESERPGVHLKIGRLWLRNTPEEKMDEQCFDITTHLNFGISQITEQAEKRKLAELNLLAGKKAKESSAFEPSLRYFKTGIDLLPADSWQTHYGFTLSLFEEACESAYIRAEYENMKSLSSVILKEARTVLDTVKCYEVIIDSYIHRNMLPDAIEAGLTILGKLGVQFPKKPNKFHLIASLLLTKFAIVGKNIDGFLDRPQVENDRVLSVMEVIRLISVPMYLSTPNYFSLAIFKIVRLATSYGNGPKTSRTFVGFAIILCGALHEIEKGYKFGSLSLKLAEKFKKKDELCFVTFCFDCFIRHWKCHVRDSLDPLQKCYQLSLEAGSNTWAGYSQMWYAIWSFVMGKNLVELEPVMVECMEACRMVKHQASYLNTGIFLQTAVNLMGRTTDPLRLAGKYFDEEKTIHLHFEANERYGLHCVYLLKLFLCYLFHHYTDALDDIDQAREYEGNAISTFNIPLCYFYESLTHLAIFHNPGVQKKQILKKVKSNQKRMKKWAHHGPMNYLHKFDLVEAEKYRVLGKDTEARVSYNKAIAGAKENGYIQEEALANELAARFYQEKGQTDKAKKYMKQARYCYEHWGAKAKVDHLGENYPELLSEDIPADRRTTSGTTTTQPIKESQLDLTSVIKASQVISGEIEIQKLLSRVMDIIIENAGAQKGCLILESEDDRFCIEAQGHIDGKDSHVPESIPVTNSNLVPESIIQYVARTRENLVIADATDHHEFATDAYILENRPKSILCAPLIHRNKTSGIVYLENNLTTGAFTTERVEILSLLCSQAAISLENAGMYQQQQAYAQTLEEKVAERTAELNQSLDTIKKTRDQLVQSEKMAALGSLVAGVAHEVNTPIGVAVSAASHLEDMTSAFVNKMESNQIKRSDLNQYTKTAVTASTLILKNLSTAVKIVQGFKQVAVDQTSGERREFKLKAYIEDVLLSLQPKLKKTKHSIRVDCPDDLLLNSYPGAFSQIISNLIMNSLLHGFEGIETGEITFEVRQENTDILFIYKDNGKGMTDQTLARIFDPFFTTKRSQGGSGLGMHIVHNLATRTLGGNITCESQPDCGITLTIQIPMMEKE